MIILESFTSGAVLGLILGKVMYQINSGGYVAILVISSYLSLNR